MELGWWMPLVHKEPAEQEECSCLTVVVPAHRRAACGSSKRLGRQLEATSVVRQPGGVAAGAARWVGLTGAIG
jgi:hypothetical protein